MILGVSGTRVVSYPAALSAFSGSSTDSKLSFSTIELFSAVSPIAENLADLEFPDCLNHRKWKYSHKKFFFF